MTNSFNENYLTTPVDITDVELFVKDIPLKDHIFLLQGLQGESEPYSDLTEECDALIEIIRL